MRYTLLLLRLCALAILAFWVLVACESTPPAGRNSLASPTPDPLASLPAPYHAERHGDLIFLFAPFDHTTSEQDADVYRRLAPACIVPFNLDEPVDFQGVHIVVGGGVGCVSLQATGGGT